MGRRSLFQHPSKCPQGHRQISWFAAETVAHCWLCDKDYPLSECIGTANNSSNPKREQELPERFEIEAGEMGKADLERMKHLVK